MYEYHTKQKSHTQTRPHRWPPFAPRARERTRGGEEEDPHDRGAGVVIRGPLTIIYFLFLSEDGSATPHGRAAVQPPRQHTDCRSPCVVEGQAGGVGGGDRSGTPGRLVLGRERERGTRTAAATTNTTTTPALKGEEGIKLSIRYRAGGDRRGRDARGREPADIHVLLCDRPGFFFVLRPWLLVWYPSSGFLPPFPPSVSRSTFTPPPQPRNTGSPALCQKKLSKGLRNKNIMGTSPPCTNRLWAWS